MLNDDFLVESHEFIVFYIKIAKNVHRKTKGFYPNNEKTWFFILLLMLNCDGNFFFQNCKCHRLVFPTSFLC